MPLNIFHFIFLVSFVYQAGIAFRFAAYYSKLPSKRRSIESRKRKSNLRAEKHRANIKIDPYRLVKILVSESTNIVASKPDQEPGTKPQENSISSSDEDSADILDVLGDLSDFE